MVALLLFLILLVIAWPVFAIFGATLFVVIGSHMHIIVPTVIIAIAYLAFLAPIAKRNNIKLGGKYGEPLDPSKPIGPEFQKLMRENGDDERVEPSFFNAPEDWKRVPRDPAHTPHQDQPSVISRPERGKHRVIRAVLALIVVAALIVLLIDRRGQIANATGLFQANASSPAVASPRSASAGRWLVRPGHSATLDASSGTNYLGEPVSLTVWCDGRPNLRLDFNDYLGSDQGIDGFKTVILQAGAAPVEQFRMTVGPDQTALLLNGRLPDLLPGFLREGVLSVYTAPYNAEPIWAKFDLTGAKAALSTVFEACPLPTTYDHPQIATLSFNGDSGVIYVRKTGDRFAFTRTTPPGAERLYGDCRVAAGQVCEVNLEVTDGKLVKIWSASVPVGSP